MIKAVLITSDGGLKWAEVADPVLKPGYVVIKVRAAGVNRADLLQAAGKYPPPPGWPDWPGLECSGMIEAAPAGSRWQLEYVRLFDRVVDNSKALAVTGMRQSDMMPLYDGLKMEIWRTPLDYPWPNNDRMDAYLAGKLEK